MKKYILAVALVFSSIPTFSQTKIETEEWIKGKFNKWKITNVRSEDNSINGSSEKPISLTFSNCYLTLKTKLTYFLAPSSPNFITYKLNIGDIEEFKWVKYNYTNYFVIITKKSQVQVTTGLEESYIDRCVIAFNIEGEDDFEQRILKAFNHLKKMCPISIRQKETF